MDCVSLGQDWRIRSVYASADGSDNGGEWIVEQHGVDPDYVVPQRPDLVVSGHDPQREKAIELAKGALKDYQGVPLRPKYPSVKE